MTDDFRENREARPLADGGEKGKRATPQQICDAFAMERSALRTVVMPRKQKGFCMADYRNTDGKTATAEPRSNTGMVIGGIVVAILIVVGLLFATGFWSADVKGGALPTVDVSADGGALPDVDVKSKELVVGTSKTTVDVPKIETEKTTIDVPTVGVKDGDNKK